MQDARRQLALQRWAREHQSHVVHIIGCPFCASTASKQIMVPRPVVKRT